jgi:hypothetical protein
VTCHLHTYWIANVRRVQTGSNQPVCYEVWTWVTGRKYIWKLGREDTKTWFSRFKTEVYDSKHVKRPSTNTVSKALAPSRKTALISHLSNFLLTLWTRLGTCSVLLGLGLNPNCSSRSRVTLRLTVVSQSGRQAVSRSVGQSVSQSVSPPWCRAPLENYDQVTALRPTKPPIQLIPEVFSPEVERGRTWRISLTASVTKVKNDKAIYFSSPCRLHDCSGTCFRSDYYDICHHGPPSLMSWLTCHSPEVSVLVTVLQYLENCIYSMH